MATTKETDLTKVTTMASSDIVRVVVGEASRNILLSNLIPIVTAANNSIFRVVTSTVNYVASNANDIVLMDLTSGNLSTTLPDAAISEGKIIQVKKIDVSTNDLTMQTNGGNIDGSATATLSGSGGAKPGASFVSDGANWFILNA